MSAPRAMQTGMLPPDRLMATYLIIGIVLLAVGAIAFFALGGKKEEPKPALPARKADQPDKKPAPASAESTKAEASRPSSGPSIEARRQYLDDDEGNGEDTQPNPWILVTAVGRTDPGMKRKNNEDAYLVLDDHHLFVVADGMGRHKAGEIASRLAVDTVGGAFASGDFGDHPFDENLAKEANRLAAVFHLANKTVFEQSQAVEDYTGMGTTMVSLHFSRNKERAAVAHAGDSRCYRLRGGKLEQLTTDHTLGAAGIVGPSAFVLSKAVGIEPNLEPDVQIIRPQPDDVYLICSDGLSRMVPNEEIVRILSGRRDLDAAANQLIDQANKAGGRDNVTVILVRVERAPMPGA